MGCVGVIKPTYFIIIISIHSSIHAPTWGATTGAHDAYPLGAFQSTHPHGVRRQSTKPPSRALTFQSTHPHGVRRHNLATFGAVKVFQSTHPHGVRPH